MKDLNFFEPYIENTEFRIDKRTVLLAIVMFFILSLGTYTVYKSIIIRQEDRIVERLRTTAENPRTLQKVEKIQQKIVDLDEFKKSVEEIRHLDETIEKRNIIDESLLDEITSKMPKDLFLTSLSIVNKEIQIIGISKDKLSIAELEKGFEDFKDLDETFISSIYLEDGFYNFAININLKDVNGNGEEVKEGELVDEESND